MSMGSISLQQSRKLRYVTFFYLYVMQGVPSGFALTAVANYLAAAGHTPQATGRFVALVGLPWVIQFLWGPIIDRFQGSPMGRRRPWVLFSQFLALLASLGLLLVRNPADELFALTLAFLVHSIFASVQDASVDAMAISAIPEHERGRINAFMRGGMLFGTGVGAAALAYLMRNGGFFHAALAQSIFLMLMTLTTFFIKESPEDSLLPWAAGKRERARPADPPHPMMTWSRIYAELFRGFFAAQSLRTFGAIIAVYLCASVFIRTFSVHLIQQLRWDDTELSVLMGTYGMMVAMTAILVAGTLSDRIGMGRMLRLTMFLIGSFLVAFSLMFPLWEDTTLARAGLIAWYAFNPGYSVAAMPVLMALCREGVEGSQFTTYMAMVNLSDVAGAYVSGYALLLLPAPLIGLCCGIVVLGVLVAVWRPAAARNTAVLA